MNHGKEVGAVAVTKQRTVEFIGPRRLPTLSAQNQHTHLQQMMNHRVCRMVDQSRRRHICFQHCWSLRAHFGDKLLGVNLGLGVGVGLSLSEIVFMKRSLTLLLVASINFTQARGT